MTRPANRLRLLVCSIKLLPSIATPVPILPAPLFSPCVALIRAALEHSRLATLTRNLVVTQTLAWPIVSSFAGSARP